MPILDTYFSFVDKFYSIDWRGIYNTTVIVISVIDAVLVSLFIYVLWLFKKLDEMDFGNGETPPVHMVPIDSEVRSNWEEIRTLAKSENPSDWNMAIIRADALMDDALMHLGYDGETMGDRLKIMDPVQMPSLDRVWAAHRVRNIIVHDPMTVHTKETIVNALRAYQDAFRELKLLKEDL